MTDERQRSAEEAVPFDFSSVHTDNVPKLLSALNVSLAVTSYQSARLFFVRSDGETLDTCFKAFPRPMGVYADRDRLTLGTFAQVLEFKRSAALLARAQGGALDDQRRMTRKVLEKGQEALEQLRTARQEELEAIKRADALYVPRAALTTGMINIHDIAWGDEGLWVVNSTFSCLSTLSPDYSFVARWKPPFISELVPEDRCHLNGMALKDGRPKYVTTFNREDRRDSWNDGPVHDGTLIDVDTNEVLLEGLIMPHSPRWHDGYVYLCESGRGLVHRFDPATGELKTVIKLPGYPRGMAFVGSLMFVGLSKVRTSDIKNPIPISMELESSESGVWVIDLDTGREAGYVRFEGDVDQIYDIAVVPEGTWPELVNQGAALTRHLFDFVQEELT